MSSLLTNDGSTLGSKIIVYYKYLHRRTGDLEDLNALEKFCVPFLPSSCSKEQK